MKGLAIVILMSVWGRVEGSFESHTLLVSPPLGVQTGLKDIIGVMPLLSSVLVPILLYDKFLNFCPRYKFGFVPESGYNWAFGCYLNFDIRILIHFKIISQY
jgi:hypothetical protein